MYSCSRSTDQHLNPNHINPRALKNSIRNRLAALPLLIAQHPRQHAHLAESSRPALLGERARIKHKDRFHDLKQEKVSLIPVLQDHQMIPSQKA